MKEIVYNEDLLKDTDIDEIVTRTKAILINENNEIYLGYSNQTYQFPGGHLINGESLNDCLIREIKEETGIKLPYDNFTPFFHIKYYSKNYRQSGKNRENNIYYFLIKTTEDIHPENMCFDEWEIEGNFEIRKVNYDNLRKTLINSIPDNPLNKVIVNEMLLAINEYENNYN
jgi:8-oxo-dGTP pyrophosphatase MutT (NUDIX family)